MPAVILQEQPSTATTDPNVVAVPSPRTGVDWSIAAPLLLAHGLSLAAPWVFTWIGFVLFILFYLVSGSGVTLGAHRLFTHQTFRAKPILRRSLLLMFMLSAQGSLLRWVRDHHIHHAFADREGDPHTPQAGDGFWNAQLTWLWKSPPSAAENKRLYERFGSRLRDDAWVAASARPAVLLSFHLAVMAAVYLFGACMEAGFAWSSMLAGWYTGLSCLVWGIFLRIIAVLHATSLVNSAAHLWGSRRYATAEGSRNNGWVAILSLGEGWHNNHHARPAAANQGFHAWWEFDLSFCLLCLAARLGLATDLRVYRADRGKTEIWFPSKRIKNTTRCENGECD